MPIANALNGVVNAANAVQRQRNALPRMMQIVVVPSNGRSLVGELPRAVDALPKPEPIVSNPTPARPGDDVVLMGADIAWSEQIRTVNIQRIVGGADSARRFKDTVSRRVKPIVAHPSDVVKMVNAIGMNGTVALLTPVQIVRHPKPAKSMGDARFVSVAASCNQGLNTRPPAKPV